VTGSGIPGFHAAFPVPSFGPEPWSRDNQVNRRRRSPCCGPGRASGNGRGVLMAAMKPRTGDGPMEVTKEGRGIVMRVPLEGGGRLVVELSPNEATTLSDALKSAAG
jgi:hypothetical protein